MSVPLRERARRLAGRYGIDEEVAYMVVLLRLDDSCIDAIDYAAERLAEMKAKVEEALGRVSGRNARLERDLRDLLQCIEDAMRDEEESERLAGAEEEYVIYGFETLV